MPLRPGSRRPRWPRPPLGAGRGGYWRGRTPPCGEHCHPSSSLGKGAGTAFGVGDGCPGEGEKAAFFPGQAVFAGGDELVDERCFLFLQAVLEQDQQSE